MNSKPGDMFLGNQSSPDGSNVMWRKFVYREISPYDKLMFVQSFSDKEGNTVRVPFNPNWPLEILNILSLEEEDGKTRLTLQGGPIGATEEERAAFQGMVPMLEQGFGGTFDQLADYLASQC